MENASKALLIAGAVLIVILLIGVGMMVFNGSKENVDSAMDTVSAQQIQVFNGQFAAYEGSQKASNIRALVQAVKASNGKSTHDINVYSGSTGTTELDTSALSSSDTKTVKFEYDTNGYINVIRVY